MKRPSLKSVPPAVGEYIGRLETALKQTRENYQAVLGDLRLAEDSNRKLVRAAYRAREKAKALAESI